LWNFTDQSRANIIELDKAAIKPPDGEMPESRNIWHGEPRVIFPSLMGKCWREGKNIAFQKIT
jgi:hypothetical protein